jgi:glycosyltransferase involved in cell wall biosynthesis
MHKPRLAILIPAYNAAGHLPRLLRSIAAQTEPFDEVWVYDDCSTDNTAEIAEGYGARVVRGKENRGCAHGKNVLVGKTDAEWIHFHDADDELKPTFVAVAHKWMRAAEADVVLFSYEERDDLTGTLLANRFFDAADLARDPRSYAIRVQINPFCGLYRRAKFMHAGGYDEDPLVLYNEDVAMHIRLAFSDLSFAAEQEICIINHRRSSSMSASNRPGCLRAHYQVMRRTAMRAGAQRYGKEIGRKLWEVAGGLTAELDWETADLAVALAMKLAGPSVAPSGTVFKALCQVSPHLALRVREWLIRGLRPSIRRGYPGWRLFASLI